ncbi:unnamed protein product [Moneuplotes crassus]|uniref:Uncharacterized protein n=1 Tax=Euplotes crassus TaxID=5936 RepID=A0AAD2DB20_EUPCR|nr:unnamed protein product [Moneuplotes crassus]
MQSRQFQYEQERNELMNRKELILQRLEKERELRRQHIREGTIEQFQLEDFSDNNYSGNYESYRSDEYQNQQISEMKDPSQILLLEPDDYHENEMYEEYQPEYGHQIPNINNEAMMQGYNPGQPMIHSYKQAQPMMQQYNHEQPIMQHHNQEEPMIYSYNDPINEEEYNEFGFNPENLYDPNTMSELHHSDRNKENETNLTNNPKKKSTKRRNPKHNFKPQKCTRKSCQETKIPKPRAVSRNLIDKPSTLMNPTISSEIATKEKEKLRNEAKMILKEAEQQAMDQCSFKPDIKVNESFEKDLTQEERWRRLLEPKTTKIQQYEKAKIEKERKKVEETCSFRPNIQKPPVAKRKPADFVDRLHSEANRRQEKREKLKRKLEEERMRDCSFKPKIENPNRVGTCRSFSHRPIYERVDEIQKNKNDYLTKLKVETEMNNDHINFQPKVNKQSEKILEKKAKMGQNMKNHSVVKRLTEDAAIRIEKEQKKREEINYEISAQYPFKPQLSTYSTPSLENKNFHERQQEFLHKKHERQEFHRNNEGRDFTFKPQINSTSAVIVEADPDRCTETREQKYGRLYKTDFQKAETTRQTIEQELYGKYDFKPQICPLSRVMAAQRESGNLLEYTQNTKSTLGHSVHQEIDSKSRKECTFKPKINRNYTNVKSAYVNKSEMKAKLQEKAMERRQKEEQKRMDREYEELRDCTFKPTINTGIPEAHNEIVVVRGLSRHMELQELKQKKDHDRLQREIEVFGLGHKFSPYIEQTDISYIPEPDEN